MMPILFQSAKRHQAPGSVQARGQGNAAAACPEAHALCAPPGSTGPQRHQLSQRLIGLLACAVTAHMAEELGFLARDRVGQELDDDPVDFQ
eukprot:8620858-Heterocapsa_arctica.AAC.1